MSVPSAAIPENLQAIAWKNLQVGKIIGQGGYSEVFRGTWNGKDVAIKQLLLKKLPEDLIKDFENETKVMAECSKCANVVKLLGVCLEEGHYAMIMEYVEKGSLHQILRDAKIELPWQPVRYKIALDIGRGLSYLHDREILHRDLKSLNILLDGNFNAKITDFGLSKIKLETKSTSTLHKQSAGTIRWKPPELFKYRAPHTKASDIYSYGMILWEIASRKLPFSDADDDVMVMGFIKDGVQETIPTETPPEYSKLITRAWAKEPDKRPSSQYIVLELEKQQPKPKAKSWHIDPETKVEGEVMGKKYALVPASSKDFEKVVKFYSHHPVPGYEIGSVKVIYNPQFNRGFEVHLGKLQERDQNPAFAPRWSWDENPKWREKVHEIASTLSKPYVDPEYPQVKLFPLWHGTDPAILDSICRTGYANLATTDAGFFGKGLYSAHEAEYAYRVYSKGALVLNWVAVFSPYPVIDGDMNKLAGKANYQNYDAHFIPVFPKNPGNPHEVSYIPCKPFTPHTYTEVVVFESAACLPRYLVELQPTLTKQVKGEPQIPPKTNRPLPKSPTSVVADKSSINSEPTKPEEQYKLGLQYFNGDGVKQDYARAAKYFQLAADKGYAYAQFRIGYCYRNGLGVEKDKAKEAKYLKHAIDQGVINQIKLSADQGNADAQRMLGLSYDEGIGVQKNDENAFKYYKLAADQGDSHAQACLGDRYRLGKGINQDFSEAFKYYKLAADQGDSHAQAYFGDCYRLGKGIKQDFSEAFKYYKLAADQGDSHAHTILGDCYRDGKGVKQDYSEAFKYYKLAADQGNSSAQASLGDFFRDGKGVEKDDSEAFKYYKLAADQGYAYAQDRLGDCYRDGKGVNQDFSEAFRYYKLAADQGNKFAQTSLGRCYFTGRGVKQDYSEAFKYCKLAADQGNDHGQTSLGFCYLDGTGVKQDYIEAIKYFKLAADQGNAQAQKSLGDCYFFAKGVKQDYIEAFRYYKLAADQGNADAQSRLGNCYRDGIGFKQDYIEAFKYYKLAADQGYAVAQSILGNCYRDGKGVKQNDSEAFKYFKLAADQGNAQAQASLGDCYLDGKGVKQNYTEAIKYYQSAAEQGHIEAQYALGNCYLDGTGVKKDANEAVKYYELAADQGMVFAQNSLGDCYRDGKGVKQNDTEAIKYYKLAADQGNAYAQKNFDQLSKK